MTLNRRHFLQAAGTLALGAPALLASPSAPNADACIFLFLVGGPSQLDTWDPKPDAPSEIRGPFQPIRTRIPGVLLAETFPHLAGILDRVALVRTLHHDASPVHETGHQLMQCGRLHEPGSEHPHVAAALAHAVGGDFPWAVLGGPIGNTGVSVGHGQGAGYLGAAHEPVFLAPDPRADERYGDTPFGRACLQARRLVEAGTRFVTVNMFDRVLETLSWDCHADDTILPTTLADYRETLCPVLDRALTALVLDLEERARLDRTLIVAAGEFGRTPRLNRRGGRDHWPGAWTALLAGGGVRGGCVLGRTDGQAAEPLDRPATPAELVATLCRAFGVPADATIPGPDGGEVRMMTAEPLHELLNRA